MMSNLGALIFAKTFCALLIDTGYPYSSALMSYDAFLGKMLLANSRKNYKTIRMSPFLTFYILPAMNLSTFSGASILNP